MFVRQMHKKSLFLSEQNKKRLLSGEGVYSWTIVTDEDTFVSTPFEKMKLSEASSAKKAINKPFMKRFANDRDCTSNILYPPFGHG